jgi:hypothetical protein
MHDLLFVRASNAENSGAWPEHRLSSRFEPSWMVHGHLQRDHRRITSIGEICARQRKLFSIDFHRSVR